MRRFLRALCIGAVISISSASVSFAQTAVVPPADTDIPRTLSYQGILRTNDGRPMPDGDYAITACLYSDTEGRHRIWKAGYIVSVQDGVFDLRLGEGDHPLPASEIMGSALWAGIQIGDSPELRPLTPLLASAYALNVANHSITKGKMATDYIESIALNGERLSGAGAAINIVAGDGIHAHIDPGTNNVVLSTDVTSASQKGAQSFANTVVTGTLAVYSSTMLNTSGGSTALGSNSNSVPGILTLAQGSSGGHVAALRAAASMSTDATFRLPAASGTLVTSENLSAGSHVVPTTPDAFDLGTGASPFRTLYVDPITLIPDGPTTQWVIAPEPANTVNAVSGTSGRFRIGTGDGGLPNATIVERLSIAPNGKVGINQSAPTQLMEVKDGNVLLSNSGTAGQLQFKGTGSGVSSLKAGAQGTTTIDYTLPITAPTTGQLLTTTSGGAMSWTNASSLSVSHAATASAISGGFHVAPTTPDVASSSNPILYLEKNDYDQSGTDAEKVAWNNEDFIRLQNPEFILHDPGMPDDNPDGIVLHIDATGSLYPNGVFARQLGNSFDQTLAASAAGFPGGTYPYPGARTPDTEYGSFPTSVNGDGEYFDGFYLGGQYPGGTNALVVTSPIEITGIAERSFDIEAHGLTEFHRTMTLGDAISGGYRGSMVFHDLDGDGRNYPTDGSTGHDPKTVLLITEDVLTANRTVKLPDHSGTITVQGNDFFHRIPVTNTGSSASVFETTVTDPNANSSSVIVATVLRDANSASGEDYSVNIKVQNSGNFVVRVRRVDGTNILNAEGVTISYAVFN